MTANYRQSDTRDQVAELARLCARLPLALRIASERAAARPQMPLRELITDLRSESSLWDALAAEEETEADTVRSVFAWSYRALPAAAGRVFRLLGLHPGSDFGIGAAAALAAALPDQIKAHLDLLTGVHMLEQTAATRYQFHDLLRAYAVSQTHREDDIDHQRGAILRVAQWYLHSARAASAAAQSLYRPIALSAHDPSVQPLSFTDYTAAMEWFATERANLLALVRAVQAEGLDEITWQMALILSPLYAAHAAFDDWLETTARALGSARRLESTKAQAALQQMRGMAHRAVGDLPTASGCHYIALDLFTNLGDEHGVLEASNSLGLIHLERRELKHAEQRFERCLAAARDTGQHAWVATTLDNLAGTHVEAGRFDTAVDLAAQALELCRSTGIDPWLHIDPLLTLARIDRETGRLAQAQSRLRAAAQIIDDGVVYHTLEYAIHREQAALALTRGEHEQAIDGFRRCVNLSRALADRRREALALDGIGQTLHSQGRPDEAVGFHHAASTLLRERANPRETAEALAHLA
ncbi:MAG: tetratricopeptide repeat protein, partial [Sciscionella sp.]